MIQLQSLNAERPSEFRSKNTDVKKYFVAESEIDSVFAFHGEANSELLVTEYFDTPDNRLFADQFRKTTRRFKIRSRRIGESLPIMEVKVKGSQNPKRIWESEPGTTLENGGQEFIRKALDEAFDTLFARRIEQQLKVVATTKFERTSYLAEDKKNLFDFDRNIELLTTKGSAKMKPDLVLIELSSLDEQKTVPESWKSVKFSKFGATLDLLSGERVRSHKLGVLDELFVIY